MQFWLYYDSNLDWKSLADNNMKAVLSKTLSFIFDTIDFNRDGDISKDEFSTYFKSLRINDDGIIQHVFTAMDTNNDGTVNKQGILFLFLRFFIKSKLNFIQKWRIWNFWNWFLHKSQSRWSIKIVLWPIGKLNDKNQIWFFMKQK